MIDRKIFSCLIVLTVSLALQGVLKADIRSDSQQSTEWFSQQMANVMGFHAASMPLLPADVLGFPGGEAGLVGGLSVSKIDVSGYKSLSFTSLNNQGGEISLPEDVALPGGLFHAKVGLPGNFDLGIKYGKVDFDQEEADAESKFSNTVYGIEVRRRLLGGGLTGVALPDLAFSFAYDAAKGDVSRKERYNAPLLSGGSLDAQTTWRSEWNVSALTVRALVSKKILVITPYAGAGYTTLLGDADTTVDVLGTSQPGNVSVNESVKGSADADNDFFQLMGGVEISPLPLVRLGLGYLWSPDDWSATVGLRIQFP